MVRRLSYVGAAVFVACTIAYAQSEKLADQEFKKLAQSHSYVAPLCRSFCEAAEALRSLVKLHQDLAKEHAKK